MIKKDLINVLKRYKSLHNINIGGLNKTELAKLCKQIYENHIQICPHCKETGYHCQTGGDLFEPFRRIKKFFIGARKSAPPIMKKFLKTYGDFNIDEMHVCRKPIHPVINGLINAISLGQYEKNKAKLYYDDMFHLFILAKMSRGDQQISVKMEKNHVINIELSDDVGEECLPVNLSSSTLKLNEFIKNGQVFQQMGHLGKKFSKDFYNYNPVNNNCQSFVTTLLRGNKLDTKELEDFTLQNAQEILTGYSAQLGSYVTDLAGRFDRLLYGDSLKK